MVNGPPIKSPQGTGEPSPRGFAIGTGLVMVVCGAVLFLGSCCFWSFGSGQWNQSAPATWRDYLAAERLPATLALASVLVTLLGGLGVFAAGVGLYGEKPSAGPLGWIATLGASLAYWALAALQFFGADSIRGALFPAALALLMSFLFFLAVEAAAVMRRHPPPPDQNRVTDDWLERQKQKRRPSGD